MSESNPGASGEGPRHRLGRHLRRWWWAWYLLLVLLSHAPELAPKVAPAPTKPAIEIPATTRAGPLPNRTIRLAYEHWPVPPDAPPRSANTPIIYLHGSPGDASNFAALAPKLADDGFEGIAPDLPGFGESDHWIPDYSVRAHAHAVLAMMDALHIDRAHLVVWSMGGGVALNTADLAPDRVASITLIAAIAAQETEGSGDYHFEHAKYALGYAGFVIAAELVPLPWHTDRWFRHSWIRNFFDTDQRPIGAIMQRLQTPTLILQGRHDILVPYWAAKRHHELIGQSQLVMLDANHFIPVIDRQARIAATWIERFIRSVERGEPLTGEVNLAPHPLRTWTVARFYELGAWIRSWHWAMQSLLFAALGTLGITPAIAIAGLLRATEDVNIAVSLVGILAFRVFTPGPPRLRRPDKIILQGVAIWALTLVAWLVAAQAALLLADRLGGIGLLCGFLLALLAVHILRNLWTRQRRQRARGKLARVLSHEFWPPFLFYLPLIPWLILLSIRHRSPLIFTCVNPGISNAGGVAGESKIDILRALRDDAVLEAHTIDAGPTHKERADAALRIMEQREHLREFPIILKPLAGERGRGVQVIHSPQQLREYFKIHSSDIIVQQYHPGPIELGVLWIRNSRPTEPGGPVPDANAGRVFSITRKQFPYVVGDGKHSIKQLILAHRRFRCQTDFFFRRLAERADDIPRKNESIPLGAIGNHAQGAIFHDGADLITPELSRRIDRIANSLRTADDRPALDFGRFDIRVPSLADASAGRNLAVVELNGATAESTNIYDPNHSAIWAYAVLFRQWAALYRLGAWRRASGARPISLKALLAMLWRHHGPRSASSDA